MRIILFTSIALTFLACDSGSDNTDVPEESTNKIDLRNFGDSITALAQQTLLLNVGAAMQNGGPDNAVDFCNIHASSLTDSLSAAHHAQISRISEKNRSPKNKASEQEQLLLHKLEKNKQKDTVVHWDNREIYYKTIRIGMPACLKCHGFEKTDISESTVNLLNERYPDDKAKGYRMNDFRGAWKLILN